MIKEFKEFIAKGNVVDLAVAVIIGGAFALIVKAFTEQILMPLIGVFGDKPSFDKYTLTIRDSEIMWGSFLTAVINFLIIAVALFVIVKAINKAATLRQSKEAEEEAEATEVELLTEIRDLLVQQSKQA